ncbi:MAG: ABA4-like family protein, partial [Anaerolineales bacterium]
ENIFLFSNALVLLFWALMIALPVWRWTQRIIGSPWVAAPAALLYAGLVLPRLPLLVGALANPQLPAIAALLGTPAGATIAWAHFLTFDLFTGRWAYLDNQQRGLPALLMAPLLLLILLFGPLGLLLYLGARSLKPARVPSAV